MEKCSEEYTLKISFKYFEKSFSIPKLLSKVSWIQTTISGGILSFNVLIIVHHRTNAEKVNSIVRANEFGTCPIST